MAEDHSYRIQVAAPMNGSSTHSTPRLESLQPKLAIDAAPVRDIITLHRFEAALASLPAVVEARVVAYAKGAARLEIVVAYPGAPWEDELRQAVPGVEVFPDEYGGAAVALPDWEEDIAAEAESLG